MVVQRLFDLEFPPQGNSTDSTTPDQRPVLFAAPADECVRMKAFDGAKLQMELRSSKIAELRTIGNRVTDNETLAAVVKLACGI